MISGAFLAQGEAAPEALLGFDERCSKMFIILRLESPNESLD